MEYKSQLRSKLFQKRSALSSFQAKDLSNEINEKLIDHINWQKIKTINAYQAIELNKEVDIGKLLDFLRQNHSKIYIELIPNRIYDSQEIPKNKVYDLIIVPVVGFDRTGNRLGYGGGYYDKFLARNKCRQTIGLAYSFQEVENIPAEEHDQKLDLIITEKEIIKS